MKNLSIFEPQIEKHHVYKKNMYSREDNERSPLSYEFLKMLYPSPFLLSLYPLLLPPPFQCLIIPLKFRKFHPHTRIFLWASAKFSGYPPPNYQYLHNCKIVSIGILIYLNILECSRSKETKGNTLGYRRHSSSY